MKKYFLGLLVIPFSLIAFSSASCETFEYNSFNGSPVGYIHNVNFEAGQTFKVLSIIGKPFVRNNDGHTPVQNSCFGITDGTKYFTVGETFTFDGYNPCTFQTYNSSITFSLCIPDPPILPGGSDGLTFAVNGLRDTVYQIIPFVIYIGIGVLISILGFYAIRWLVNWIGGKINSYFNSKRD